MSTTSFTSDADGKALTAAYDYASGKSALAENRYDDLGRLTAQGASANNQPVYWMNYLYKELSGQKSTQQIQAVDYTFGSTNTAFNRTYTYTYDANGNITGINKNGALNQGYVYDGAGQLVRVNDASQNKTITYQYDAGGNIRVKKEYAYTTGTLGSATSTINYTYGDSEWKDLLTAYNGKSITYDANGNPLTYDGWTYTWEAGRQLKRMTKSGSTVDYKYDDSGIRTQKTVGSITTNYTLADGRVTAQETGGAWTYFRYDESDALLSLNWNGAEYFYVKNIQGDVIGIVDASGTLVVEYTYDAWGKQLTCTGSMAGTLGAANPFRYRSYYYDSETGYYYCQSRYYNAEWGRWINADVTDILYLTQGEVLGANLFAYCMSNPIMRTDPTGHYGWWDFYRAKWFVSAAINLLISLIVGGSIAAVTSSLKKLAAKQGRYAFKSWLTSQIQGKFARTALKTAFKAKIIAVVGVVVDVILTIFDIGGWIFDIIDSNDKKPRNGYWDF